MGGEGGGGRGVRLHLPVHTAPGLCTVLADLTDSVMLNQLTSTETIQFVEGRRSGGGEIG